MTLRNRIFSLVLALVMLISMLPMPAANAVPQQAPGVQVEKLPAIQVEKPSQDMGQTSTTAATITLVLKDSYGDGWNGNQIAVYIDSAFSGNYTISSGSSGSYTISYDSSKNYEFQWVKGSYASECSFEIKLGSEVKLAATKSMCGNYTNGQSLLTIEADNYNLEGEFAGGTGISADPYLVATKAQLDNVRNYPEAHFRQVKNITFVASDFSSSGDFYNNGQGWEPIDNFKGSYDGNGFSITGLTIVRDVTGSGHYIGLFAYTQGDIANVDMVDLSYTVTGSASWVYIGGVAAYGSDQEVIGCSASGTMNVAGSYVGGIVGYGDVVKHCTNHVDIAISSGYSDVGGIVGGAAKVGYCDNYGTISHGDDGRVGGIVGNCWTGVYNCTNSGSVTVDAPEEQHANINVGGIVGYLNGYAKQCQNSGAVIASGDYVCVGGIAGAYYSNSTAKMIAECVNRATISTTAPSGSSIVSSGYAGGIAGDVSKGYIYDCYVTQNVTITTRGTDEALAGGIAGYFSAGTISRCYSLVNTVSVNTSASFWARGGVVGESWGTVENCYYRYSWGVAGNNGTVYNVTQITTLSGYANQSNYTGFDFTNTWKMGTGDYTYAVLRMEDGHTHSMVYNAATVTQEASGNLEHWYCAGCDTYFSDAAGGLYTTQDMIASEPLPKTGICGDNVTWSLSHEGVLIISGTGAMADYAQETDRPWNGFKDDIVSIVVMDGVTHIGDNAFDGFQSVTDVVLSNSVTSIGKDGFSCCLKLDSIVLGNCVVTIDEGAFAGCGLKTLELPDTVTTIGDGAFELSAVEYLLIPENVTSIGDRAFAGENNRLICFTGDAPALGADLFDDATVEVWYPADNDTWTENVMQNYGGTVTWNAYDTLDDVSIHSADHYDYHWTLSIIGTLTVTCRYSTVSWNYSYSRRPDWEAYKDQITAIVLKNVENVGDYMFYGYANVKTVDFGIAEAIGSRAFYDCTSLETVFLQSFTEDCVIEDYAFYNCTALQQVAFPDETTMGSYAFGYCDQLTKIYITTYGTGRLDSSYSLSLSSDSFKGVTATVYMPVGWYMTDYGDFGGTLTWAQAEFGPCGNDAFWTYDAATSTVTITGTGAIASYHHGLSYPWYGLKENVKHVVFEDGVTYIPAYVFEYMDQIQTAILPNTLEILACNAFNDCMKLNNLIIPASVTQLTGNFNRCNALTDLYYMGTAEEWANLDGNSNVGGSYDYVQTVHFLVRTEQAATCTEAGVQAHYRFDDTSVYAGYFDLNKQPIDQPATIPATGHSYENGACSVCGAEQSVVIVAQGTCGDNLIWVLDESGKLTVSGTGDMDYYIFKVSVPWDDYRDSIYTVEIGEGVTGIGNVAFCDCVNLTNVTISNTVTSIGESAFYCCRKLKYIFIPATTTSIASNAFEMCILDHAFFIGPDIHYSVAQYSERYHADCFGDEMESGACSICNPPEGVIARGKCGDNLIWLLEENGTLTISGTGAMRNWSNGLQKWYSYRNQIKTVVIEEGVTTIGTDAFNDCENLTSVSIPNSMISICDYAFAYCENLIEVTIPDYVAELGDYAFTNCASLTNVVIGNGLTVMPSYLFLYCDALTTVTIGHNITTIQGGAFYDCTNMNHVLYMGTEEQWNAISVGSDNSYLTNATRHNNCTGEEIVDGVCTICNPVNDYIAQGICGDNLTWTLDENGLLTISGTGAMTDFEDSSSMPWYAHKHNILSVVVENGVTNIGDFAFSNCTNLADVSLPDSVTKFGWLVFADCTGLTSVTIPDSVIYFDWMVFGYCSSLTSVTIPTGVTEIPMDTFHGCTGLTSVIIPAGVTYIGDRTFDDCTSLNHVLYKGTEEQWRALTIGTDNEALTNATIHYSCTGDEIVDGVCTICNPVNDYIAQGICGDNLTWTLDENGLLTISGTGAMTDFTYGGAPWYQYRDDILSVAIEDGVTSIGRSAFLKCSSLTSVTIPEGVTSIGDYAFEGCTGLTSVTIGAGLTGSFNTTIFDDCSSLTAITVSSDNPNYSSDSRGVLFNKTKTELILAPRGISGSYSIPSGVTSIGDYAFWYCSSLTSVTIPEGVTSIGFVAFSGCSSLTSVTIPDSVIYFNWMVFGYCSSLTSVTIPAGVTEIPMDTFYGCTGLTSVIIPAGVTYIGDRTFDDCTSLNHVLYKGTGEQWNAISIGSDNSYLTNATRHYNCTGDEIVDLENQICVLCCQHNGTETERQDATCTEAGLVSYVCDLCGSSYTEELSALGHDYEALVVPPTCDEPGFTKHTCTRCGEFYFSDDTSATGHTFGEWYTVTAPTCVQEGQKRRDCLVCDGYQLEALATIDHNFVTYSVTQTPTTTTEGKLSAQCEGCVDVDIVTLPALNDSDYTYAVIAVPTTSAVGTGRYTWNITTYGTWYFDVEIPQLPMESQGQITVDTVTAAPGETVTVDVRFLNNPGFGGMIFEVHYDAAVLELVDYTKDLGEDICTDSGLKDANGMVRFVYVGTENVTGDGVLISLTFLVKETAEEGLTEICVELSEDTDDFFYYDGYDMIDFLPGTENGGIEIIEYTPGDANGDGKVNNRDAARILQYLAGWDVEVNLKAMDVNGDGKVNNRDAARILQYLAGWDVELN